MLGAGPRCPRAAEQGYTAAPGGSLSVGRGCPTLNDVCFVGTLGLAELNDECLSH